MILLSKSKMFGGVVAVVICLRLVVTSTLGGALVTLTTSGVTEVVTVEVITVVVTVVLLEVVEGVVMGTLWPPSPPWAPGLSVTRMGFLTIMVEVVEVP